jgi:gliding motility-associated-like protein
MKKYKKLLMFIGLLIPHFFCEAQVFHNNGAGVYVSPGAHVHVLGSAQNSTAGLLEVDETAGNSGEMVIDGDFINNATAGGNGIYRVSGNWLNNSVFNSGTGSVFLYGDTQLISGNVSTSFYNLFLEGNGDKIQTIHQYVTNILNLNDRELLTENFTMFVENPITGAIQWTTGFVSSTDTGSLSRNTASSGLYHFPTGSSIGTVRYRPVTISVPSSTPHTFTVRMANVDATTEGFDRSLIASDICATNPLFYHRINRTSGNSPSDISIFFDEALDGTWDGVAHWTSVPQWQIVAGSSSTAGVPLAQAMFLNWNNFSETPYILYKENITVDLGPDLQVCSGDTVILDAGSGYDTYIWSPSGTGQNNQIVNSGTYHVTVSQGICSATDSISVSVFPLPSVNLGPDTTICAGDILTLDAGSGFLSYSWFPAGSSQTLDVVSSGIYAVTVTDANSCQGVDSVGVNSVPSYDATIITSSLEYCDNVNPVMFDAVDAGGIWSGPGMSASGEFNPQTAGQGIHTVIYTIPPPCGDADSVTVVVYSSPVVSLGNDTTICSGDVLILDGGTGFITYEWSPSGSGQTYTVTNEGSYAVTVTDMNACQSGDNIYVTVAENQDATILVQGPFCSGDHAFQFFAEDAGGIWTGNGITSSGWFDPAIAGAGIHEIQYVISGLCGDEDSVNIEIFESPAVEIFSNSESCIGADDGMAWVMISGGMPPYMISWSNGDSQDSITELSPGYYNVVISDQNGCTVSDTTRIFYGTDDCLPPHVFVPNIFSPNGDGENDVLFVRGEGISSIDFIVYSRWGQKIFESRNLNKGWDGTFRGSPVEPGVYVYHLRVEFTNSSEEKFKGNITLVR